MLLATRKFYKREYLLLLLFVLFLSFLFHVSLSKDDLGKENMEENFYSPLSATGYLTPLQRKKLREKRGLIASVSLESEDVQKNKMPRMVKRKRETNANVFSTREKKPKHKEPISQIQCSVARIISKTNNSVKEKKFFKTSSPSRLEKVNFSMPFVYKKNLFSVIDKNIRQNSLHLKKRPKFKEHSCNLQPPHTDSGDEYETKVPCIIKINNFSDIAEDSVHNALIDEMPVQEPAKTLLDFDWPSDEMLLKRQEEARASIKRQKVLNENVEDNEEQQNIDEPVHKLYPIFYIASRKQQKNQQDNKRKQRSSCKKLKESSNGGEQMMIDAGQKEFGAKICTTCNMIYSVAVEEDERLHLNYHNTYLINLKFPGWKEENIIGEYTDGRIIIVRKNEQSFKIKKMEDVLEIANRDLGFPTSSLPPKPDLTFILFISNTKQVAGCVVAEPISRASRVLLAEDNESTPSLPPDQKDTTWRIGNWYSSSDTVPAVCGVNRIWVAHNYRRSRVAYRMVECLRCHFVHGHVVSKRELAFTDPSPDGREFAAFYTGTDNFLVYR